MKAKLTVTIDEELVPKAKQFARAQGLSLSQLIETTLRDLSNETGPSFATRWRGQFRASGKKEVRYQQLAKKYL